MTKSIFLERLSATTQFILGFILGISLIVGISGTAIYTYYRKMSVLPEKPDYPQATLPAGEAAQNNSAAEIEPLESNTSEEATDKQEEPPLEELPPNAYRAVVTWPQGLSLRSEPELNAGKVGGIGYNATIVILEDTSDGKWQKVRLPWSGQEGWVKGNNTKRVAY